MKTRIVLSLIVLGLALQIGSGVLAIGRDQSTGFIFGVDFAYLHAAGQTWLHGENPYDFASFTARNSTPVVAQSGFVYPSQASLFVMALALLPFDASALLFAIINLAALISLARAVQYLVANPIEAEPSLVGYPGTWFPAALVMLNPGAANVIFMGQTTIVVAAALVWSWIFADRGRHRLSGVLFAIAMIKPQFALLPFLWVCMYGNRQFFVSFSLAFALFGMGAWLSADPLTMASTWLESLARYRSIMFNQPGYWNVTSLQSLLVAAGMESAPDLSIIAVLLGAAIWIFRHHFRRDDCLALLLLLGLCFIPSHTYDYIMLAPVYAALWLHCRSRIDVAVLLGFVGGMYVPRPLVSKLGPQLLVHWRTVLVLGCLMTLTWISRQSKMSRLKER